MKKFAARENRLEANINKRRNREHPFIVEVEQSNLDAVEIFSPVKKTDLKTVNFLRVIVEADLGAVNLGVGSIVAKPGNLKSVYARFCGINIHSKRDLGACHSRLFGIVVCYASHLHADNIGIAVRDIEQSGETRADKALIRYVAADADVQAIHISLMSPQKAHSGSGYRKIIWREFHRGRQIDGQRGSGCARSGRECHGRKQCKYENDFLVYHELILQEQTKSSIPDSPFVLKILNHLSWHIIRH